MSADLNASADEIGAIRPKQGARSTTDRENDARRAALDRAARNVDQSNGIATAKKRQDRAVDVASEDSFPASDAPSRTPVTGSNR